ncbi:protein of unknown function [endosymbiont DhMRE of Dentiscutata heterogama]|uniref:hypothetical protein n=1 Tax=endosymbiont DhMRE of Dentiscutata heterogama TaxID=1609546 RepID=UPI000629D477|nr:hypothetical protein [endosymbiont DhMRE of Dentiscutata heterogama]CFW93166.1 protein of unknown function [endosymbiont DhMRE of Dentiscutata heterogama]
MTDKKGNIFSRILKWIKGLISNKVNKNNNKGKNVNSPQINAGDESNITINNNRTYNIYNNSPSKDTITSPSAVKNKKKNQKKKIKKEEEKNVRQNQTENREKSEKNQEMPQQEFERLLMKVKFIAFGVMGNIKWDKIKPLEFQKNEEEEFARLAFEVGEKRCYITYKITEKDKQRLLKENTAEIVERFITLHLINHGKNDYFDYHCPDCKQTTLTRSLIVNSPEHEEAICCNLCRWATSMKVYLEYLNDKKHNSSLEFYEWLRERNRKMAKMRKSEPF